MMTTPPPLDPERVSAELEAARNGVAAASNFARTKAREAAQAKMALAELEEDYKRLQIRYERDTLQWKAMTLVFWLLFFIVLLLLAITNS
jgi:hypothetical protein